MPMTRTPAFAYLRVATSSQRFDVQRALIGAFAAANNLEIVRAFEDRVSGAKPIDARPGFLAMLKAIDEGETKIVVIESYCRLARGIQAAIEAEETLESRGATLLVVDLHAADKMPAKRLQRALFDAFAEYLRAKDELREP